MDTPLQITFKDLESSEFVERRIRDRVTRLEQFHGHIIGCRVVVDVPRRSSEGGKLPLQIAVEVDLPGRKLIAKAAEEMRETKGDRGAVINRAFEIMERQLEDSREVTSRRVKTHEGSVDTARVARLFENQNYGFLEVHGAPELYFSETALQGMRFSELQVGQLVAVTRAVADGPMGPQASTVRRIGPETDIRRN